MARVLRIVGMAAAAVASIVVIAMAGSGAPLRRDTPTERRIEKLLNSPDAVTRFRQRHTGVASDRQGTTAPMVRQAELFAGILNPARPTGRDGSSVVPPPPPPPPPVPDFHLLGTSCSCDPNQSFAYVRLAGPIGRWVGPGEKIGRCVVTQIRDGSVAYYDGTRSEVKAVEPAPRAPRSALPRSVSP